MTEDYVRPPTVAMERRTHRVAIWRFRLILFLVVAAIAVGVFFIARAIITSGENGSAQGAPRPAVTAVTGRLG